MGGLKPPISPAYLSSSIRSVIVTNEITGEFEPFLWTSHFTQVGLDALNRELNTKLNREYRANYTRDDFANNPGSVISAFISITDSIRLDAIANEVLDGIRLIENGDSQPSTSQPQIPRPNPTQVLEQTIG